MKYLSGLILFFCFSISILPAMQLNTKPQGEKKAPCTLIKIGTFKYQMKDFLECCQRMQTGRDLKDLTNVQWEEIKKAFSYSVPFDKTRGFYFENEKQQAFVTCMKEAFNESLKREDLIALEYFLSAKQLFSLFALSEKITYTSGDNWFKNAKTICHPKILRNDTVRSLLKQQEEIFALMCTAFENNQKSFAELLSNDEWDEFLHKCSCKILIPLNHAHLLILYLAWIGETTCLDLLKKTSNFKKYISPITIQQNIEKTNIGKIEKEQMYQILKSFFSFSFNKTLSPQKIFAFF